MRTLKASSRLSRFMLRNSLHPTILNSICGRTTAYLLRAGKTWPDLEMAAAIAVTFTKRLGRDVAVEELFDVKAAAADRVRQRRGAGAR